MSDEQFAELGNAFLDDHLRRHPDAATELGDHRFDAHLPDVSDPALADERRALDAFAGRLAAFASTGSDSTGSDSTGVGTAGISAEHEVDAAILRNSIERRIFELDELRDHTWDPLSANPGRAIYMVLAREFAPLPDRLESVAGRLAQVPDALATARAQLGAMPRVHLETAVGQFAGTIGLVRSEIDAALASAPQCAGLIETVRPAALAALAEHRDWLSAQLAQAGDFADPRIGADRFARKLSLTLNAAADADAILARAHADLDRVSGEIAELAAQLGGSVRQVLDRLAADAPDDASILGFCREALAAQTAFVQERDLVTVYDDPAKVIEMPEIDRGVAVAYCDPPGPLETRVTAEGALPTFLAVSPAPADWSADRVASFYREYNLHMVHNLMVHEAMPGHYLQLMHSSRFAGSRTPVRAAFWSGSFVEGWAVYAEEIMAVHGYPGTGDARAVRMQQLKMQLRMTLNAILDAGVHAHGLTEAEAMALMQERAFQEEGEAAGKWRRALLTSAQLSTYYVGYTEVSDLARDLRAAQPAWSERQLHDTMLAHGSPPARLLRTLLRPPD
jgi:uncharacterized protein (DUF885 family)